jgi:CheY-like chemotaxis protein
MASVVIVEDTPDEVEKIAKWLGLLAHEYAVFDPTPHVDPKHAQGQHERAVRALVRGLKQENPRLVLLDLQLHDVADFNGQSLCRELRSRCPELGLVCMTIMPGVEGLSQYESWGANAAWSKPWVGGRPVPDASKENVPEAIGLRRLIQQCRPAAEGRL